MEIIPVGYFDDLKRYWRRRRYQRLDDARKMKKKPKIARLGVKKNPKHHFKIKKVAKWSLTFVSPLKLMAKFHEAYVDAMIRLSGNKQIENFAEIRVPKSKPAPLLLSALNNQIVDARMVLEIYSRVVSTRQQLV